MENKSKRYNELEAVDREHIAREKCGKRRDMSSSAALHSSFSAAVSSSLSACSPSLFVSSFLLLLAFLSLEEDNNIVVFTYDKNDK